MSDKSFVLGGYATGSYSNMCKACKDHFIGDKRAVVCLPCAGKEAADTITELRAELAESIKRHEDLIEMTSLVADPKSALDSGVEG